MRLVYVLNHLATGGAERSSIDLLGALRSHGVRPSIVCLGKAKPPTFCGLVEELNLPVDYLEATRLRYQILELARFLRRAAPDVVHAATDRACLASRFAGFLARVPVVNSWINVGYDESRLNNRRFNRRQLRREQFIDALSGRLLVSRFHAVTEYVKEANSQALWIPPDRVTVVERGRELERFFRMSPEQAARERRELGLESDDVLVLTSARHDVQKGLDSLIRAAAHIQNEDPKVKIFIAGRYGPTTEELKHLQSSLGVGDVCRLLGHRDDVANLLGLADIYVCTSLWEGAAGGVIEAMAAGLPVVCSDIRPLLDTVEPGRSCITFPVNDSAQLARALLELAHDRQERFCLGARGEEICRQRFGLDRSASLMKELYLKVARFC